MWRRRSAFDELFDVFREFDSLFHRTLQDYRALPAETPRMIASGEKTPATVAGSQELAPWGAADWTWAPAVDCFTRGNDLVLKAELAGVDPSNVEVNVNGRQLTLRGEKQASQETTDRDVHYREIVHGRFQRTFTLPEGVKGDQIKATFSNGVLEITMPAEGVTKARTVPIEAGPDGRKSIKAA